MEAPLIFPDIDRRIAALAFALLCALLLAYLAYTMAERARHRAELADGTAIEAARLAEIAYRKAEAAQRSLPAPKKAKQRKS